MSDPMLDGGDILRALREGDEVRRLRRERRDSIVLVISFAWVIGLLVWVAL